MAALALGLFTTEAQSAEARSRHQARFMVVEVEGNTAYLGAGSDDGLKEGLRVNLQRRGSPAGSCQIVRTADHSALCHLDRPARVGDTFTAFRAVAVPPALTPLPPMLSRRELAREHAQLESQGFTPLAFKGTPGAEGVSPLNGEVNLTTQAWLMASASNSSYQSQSIDLSLNDAALGHGFHASLDMSVLVWGQRPDNQPLLPQSSVVQLYVRRAELSFHQADSSFAFAAGRIWPWLTPGLGVLDGVQAGWREVGGGLELGAVAGALPNALTTAPSLQQPLAGVYLNATRVDGASVFSWMQGSAVLTAFEVPAQGWHFALDATGLVSAGRAFDGAAELRLGAGTLSSPGHIEAARLDLSARPSDALQLAFSARYLYENVGEVVEPGQGSFQNASVHATADMAYDFHSFALGLTGGFTEDLLSYATRGWVGPELAWPRFFGPVGGLSVGYEQVFGWMRGADAYAQVTLRPARGLFLSERVFYFYSNGGGPNTAGSLNSAGTTLQVDYAITKSLRVRGSLMAQTDLTPSTTDLAWPLGLVVSGGLTGRF
jgi:hypothetical protein